MKSLPRVGVASCSSTFNRRGVGGFGLSFSLGLAALSLSLGVQGAHGFNIEPSQWPLASKVVMQLNLGTPAFPLQDGFVTWNASATDALAIWSGYLDLISISGVVNPAVPVAAGDGVNAVVFSPTIFGESFGDGTLAVTVIQSKPTDPDVTTEADVLVNSANRFDSYRGVGQGTLFDLHRVLLHEFGHVLGLAHYDAQPLGTKLMESFISDVDHPAADDIAGVRSIFGLPFYYQQTPLTLQQGVALSLSVGAPFNESNVISYKADGLPPGLTVNAKTGVVSGTATASGVFSSVITVVGSIADAYYPLPLTVKGFDDVKGLLGIVPGSDGVPVVDPIRPRLYACASTGVKMIDTETLQVTPLNTGQASVHAIVSADASTLYILSLSARLTIQKVDLTTLQVLPPLLLDYRVRAEGNLVEGVDHRVYIGTTTGIGEFDLVTGEHLADFGTALGAYVYHELAISPDRKTLYASGESHGTFSYDVSTAQPALITSNYYLSDMHPSSDGQYLYGLKGGTQPIARAVLPDLTATTFGDISSADAVGLAPDGTIYASAHLTSSFSASASVLVFDPISLSQTTVIDPLGSGVSQAKDSLYYPSYNISHLVFDSTGSYFFASVVREDQTGSDQQLWKFSTDLASFPGRSPVTKNLLNVSTRTLDLPGDDSMIGGFIVQGPVAKKILIRGIGPSLPITGAMGNPVLDLYDSSGKLLKSNDDWVSDRLEVVGTGLAPLSARESAITMTLPPGAYTAVVRDARQQPGLALVEIYDLDADHSLLANISTRGRVAPGDNAMIGGFIVGGVSPTRVVLRAIGPSLASHGVSAPLADPVLELHDRKGKLVSTNDNWRSTQEAAIVATGLAPSNDKESAILATLSPGSYTAIVRGQGVTTGVALVEIYNLDSVTN